MWKIVRLIVLIGMLILLFVGNTIYACYKNGESFEYNFLERHDYFNEKTLEKEKAEIYTEKLLINGISCAVDKEIDTFYYPLSNKINEGDICSFNFNFGIERQKIYINDALVENIVDLKVHFDRPYNVQLKSDEASKQYKLIFTRLPIIKIYPSNFISSEKVTSEFSIIAPNAQDNPMNELLSFISIRGGISKGFSKKSYNIELIDKLHDEVHMPLLGMRDDGDWILESCFNDASKARKKVCMDIWKDISTVYYNENIVNGVDGEYVELFINDSYMGVYLLRERIDNKLLDLKDSNKTGNSGGVIYKGYNWMSKEGLRLTTFDDIPNFAYDTRYEYWGGLKCVYPRLEDVDNLNWYPYYKFDYLVAGSSDEKFEKEINEWIDYDNIAEYYLFINLLYATDNTGKNMIWSIRDVDDPECNKLMVTAWDLDAVLGRSWKNSEYPYDKLTSNVLFDKMIKINPDNYVQLLKNKWFNLRENEFSHENIMRRFYNEYDYLIESGALDREAERWDEIVAQRKSQEIQFFEVDVDSELEYISRWLEKRLIFLDEYYETLG